MASSSSLFLGLDLGTSGCRGIVINEFADVSAEARVDLESTIDSKGHHQQHAHSWWQAVTVVIRQLAKQIDLNRIVALSVDGTSGSVLLCDKDGEPLHDALMYNDARASDEVKTLQRLGIDNSAILSPTSGLAKLLWLKQQDFSQHAHFFLHQADWINGKLLNRFGDSDVNNCLKSGYDPVNQQWPGYFSQLDINPEWLPEVHQLGDELGTINNNIAQQLGLNYETRIITGTTDSTAAIIATGAHKIGEAVTSLGSTLVTKVLSDKPVLNTEYGVYSQPFANHWLVGGASNSGGAVLKQYFSEQQLDNLTNQLEPDKSTGLDYYPLPSVGERFPVNNPNKLSRTTPRPKNDVVFFQGLLESIARIEQQAYQRMKELGAPYPTHVITCGGGATNQAWQKIRQHFLNVPVEVAQQQEAAYGMALLARNAINNKG
jgi:sugar (pentulose or hexulose) kinase